MRKPAFILPIELIRIENYESCHSNRDALFFAIPPSTGTWDSGPLDRGRPGAVEKVGYFQKNCDWMGRKLKNSKINTLKFITKS